MILKCFGLIKERSASVGCAEDDGKVGAVSFFIGMAVVRSKV